MKKRILSLLLVFTMLLGMVPGVTTAEAAGDRVHVIVENTTFTPDNAEELGATWEETFWQGTLVDTWVAIDESSTMMGCVVTALEAEGYTQTGAENNYISDINGLGEFDGGYMSGWMGTLNDWFTNQGFGAYTVADGTLEAGDEIRIMYTTAYGDDLGGSWGNSDTTVKELTFSEGELDPAFDKDTHAYTLTIPDGTASVVVTPTASNKNYQVRTRIGDTVYKRTADVPVADGTEIIVECNWPGSLSMNEGGEHQTYTITVAANTPSHDVHTLVQVEAVAATCTEKGTLEYWHCGGCGKNFADADGAEELTSVETAIDPNNHTGVDAAAWEMDETGHWHVCSACQAEVDKALHTPGPAATETTPQTCTACGYEIAPATGPETLDVRKILADTLAQLAKDVPAPAFGTGAGEWSVLALARGADYGGIALDNQYYADYYDRIVATVNEKAASVGKGGALHRVKLTENSRLILALSAIGKESTKVGDWNIVEPLSDLASVSKQGINGPIFALIALDTYGYETSNPTIRQECIDYILNKQLADGGWALSGTAADPDITAMVLQALANYRSQSAVQTAVEQGVSCLSTIQKDSGGYASWGTVNSESCAQVIVACTALGINPHTDPRFVKNGKSVVDALLTFYVSEDPGFKHIADSGKNGMATDQAAYALVSYVRFLDSKTSLYDMSDVKPVHTHSLAQVEAVAATCTEKGTLEHWHCSGCGKNFADADGAEELTSVETAIDPNNHTGVDAAAWEMDETGHWHVCSACQAEVDKALHTPGPAATETTPQTCTACGYEIAPATGPETLDVRKILADTLAQLAKDVPAPAFGTGAGEWSVLALARGADYGGIALDNQYYADYYDRIVATVNEKAASVGKGGALHRVKLTENSRLILALSAIGKESTKVGDWNIVEPLSDLASVSKQGINGPIFALIALDTYGYETSNPTIRQECIDYILNKQLADGGWALSGTAADPDITAMVLQALANYRSQSAVQTAVEQGVSCLSTIQKDSGGYASWGTVNSESCAQVIVACTALGINPHTDPRFVKNGKSVVDALLTFYVSEDPGFKHIADSGKNGMATDQAAYALVSYVRFLDSKTSLYDMSDVKPVHTHSLAQVEAVAATCTEKGTLEHWHCSGCGKNFADADGAEELATVETAIDPDNHTGVATEWSKDATGHWHVCSACQAQVDKASHNPGPAATETTPQICTVCEYVIDPATGHVEHTADTTWHSDETHHWHLCTGCGEEMDKAPHTGGKATHEELAVCEICGRGYGELEKYIITAHAGEGGRISPSGRVEVEPGEDQRFDIIPRSGYEIEEVWVDDEPMGAIDTYRFRDVDDDHSIDVTFASAADLPDYGRVVGEVYVSVENRTFPGGDFTGTLVSGWYDLCEDDTMMTCILKALAEDGYTWEGTGGKTKDGYDITYLAYIKKGSKSLGEFDGEQGSGWMGTLNDWFVNLSFQEFAVGGKGDNALEDGDVIQVMYTQNYGADIGGTWNSADTSLKDLTVSGGKLSPRFDSDVLTYELEISGSSAKVLVTPTASNKNYQVKTFLNAYNKDSAFYKRSERITVRPGDIIYVGCGDPSWASMNNQGDEAIDYSGTKYIIYVGGADLQSRIDQLPSARKITYKNYKDYVDLVAQLRKEYDKLSNPSKIDAEKLLAVEEKLAFFIEIDEVKDLLAKIPAGDRLTAADEKKVRAAGDAYNQLSREQQAYITASELANYQAALLYFGSEGEVAETVRFADVTAANWFYDDVQYVAVNGLMDGTASGRFEPYSQMTRAMLVTVLYRLEGSPSVRGTNSFSDVAQNKWYTNAVIWAAQNGIVNGLDESTFGTDSSVTREQMAAILYRYAGYRGYDTSGSRSISAFADAGKAAGYAVKAMEWTYSEGLIHGRSSTELAPKGTATRAEVAAILHRFSEKIGAR